MATFKAEVGGKTYEIEAPNQQTAWQAATQMAGPQQPRTPGMAEDVLKSIGSGLVTGTEMTLGMPGDFKEFLRTEVGDRIGNLIFGEEGRKARDDKVRELFSRGPFGLPSLNQPTSEQIASAQRAVTGFQPYEPQTTPGQFARTAAEFVPGAVALGPGGLANAGRNALAFGVVPGITSEGAGQFARSAYPEAEPLARFAGAVAGPMVAGGLRKAVTPTRSDPYAQAAAGVLEAEGIPTTAGQRTGSNALRYAEDEVGGARAAAFYDQQGEAFTRAALRRAGITADRATPEVLDDAFTALGGEFDRLAASTTARVDQRAMSEIQRAVRDYNLLTPEAARVPAVAQFAEAIRNAPGGRLTGQQYQYIRSVMAAQARQLAGSGAQGYQGASALRAFQEALDDAVERSMRDPALMRRWREVRQQYRNILPIEEAMARAGEDTAKGLLSPRALRAAISKRRDRRGYVRGQGDYAALARAGEAVLKPLPQSGTPPRLAARGLLNQTPTAIGGALGYGASGGDMLGTMAGMAGGAMSQGLINYGAREAMFSPIGRAYLSNQLLPASAFTAIEGAPAAAYGGLLAVRPER